MVLGPFALTSYALGLSMTYPKVDVITPAILSYFCTHLCKTRVLETHDHGTNSNTAPRLLIRRTEVVLTYPPWLSGWLVVPGTWTSLFHLANVPACAGLPLVASQYAETRWCDLAVKW